MGCDSSPARDDHRDCLAKGLVGQSLDGRAPCPPRFFFSLVVTGDSSVRVSLARNRRSFKSSASVLSRSITPLALFGRREALSLGGTFIPISTLAQRHLADDELSGGQLLVVTLDSDLALVLHSFRVCLGHARLLPLGERFYTFR